MILAAYWLRRSLWIAVASASINSWATPPKTIHPSWDLDKDGINDCEKDGSCDHTQNYSLPRPTTKSTPSFNCTKAKSSIETLICETPDLAILDNKLQGIYQAAQKKARNQHPPLLKAEQRGWIKGRNDCWKSETPKDCVNQAYQLRIAELQARYQLVPQLGPFRYQCGASPADELFVTFHQTEPPTLIAERGDKLSLMYLSQAASGAKYLGQNESFWEHHGEARVTWGFNAQELVCTKEQ